MNSLLPLGTRFPRHWSDFDSEIDQFRRDVNGLINRVWTGGGEVAQWYSPPCNVAETDQEYEITLDLPGMKVEDLRLEIKQGDLWITGERTYEPEAEGKTYHCLERHYGQFRRVIRLGDEVDADHVEAEYKDGVLFVRVPKAERARTRHIEVKH